MKKFLLKILVKIKDLFCSKRKIFDLSPETKNALINVDWSENDVLIGTVRTNEQFYFNLKNKCYYAPQMYVSEHNFPIKYIALYEGDLNNGMGIRYFGEVDEIMKVKRDEIPVSRNNAVKGELYYFFKVKKWVKLKKPVKLKSTVGGAPMFTNIFLLKNCSYTYQLFIINSPSQFELMHKLENKNETIYKINNKYSIIFQENNFILFDTDSNEKKFISLQEFEEKPAEVFLNMKDIIYKQPF